MANFNNTKWQLLLYQPNNNTNRALFLVKLMAIFHILHIFITTSLRMDRCGNINSG